jgi:purine-binding chemotaxis protein CheW
LNCVLISVCGLNLAIPFDGIEGALSLNSVTLQLNNQYDWMLGSFVGSASFSTAIIDTGQWLLTDRYDAALSRYEEIIVLDGKGWALACDNLVKSVRIPHSSINMNNNKQGRPWMLGTYMEERCAVIDVPALVAQLEQANQVG